MKNFKLTLCSLLLLPVVGFAQPQLKTTMKKMGQDFKTLTAQVADASKNDSSLQLAQDLLVLIPQAKDIMPDSIAKLNEPDRTTAYNDFQDRLKTALYQTQKIIEALQANDNAKAALIANELGQTKKDGHDKYK